MLAFTKKKLINSKRVCLRLRAAREAAKISLETVAERTKINPNYLLALEECRFSDIPFSSLYQKNFIKKYAEAIGVPADEFISQYFIEETKPSEGLSANKKSAGLFLTAWPSIIRSGALILCGVMLSLYLGYQVKRTIDPPSLALINPDNGFVSHENAIKLQGKTEPSAKIMVNGQTIKSNDQGEFTESIPLNTGINTIVVVAQKKHGKSTRLVRHIIYKENTSFSLKSTVLESKN